MTPLHQQQLQSSKRHQMLSHHPSGFHVPLVSLVVFLVVACRIVTSQQTNNDTTGSSASSSSRSYNVENLDSDMKAFIADCGVRGASIAFFDKVRWKPSWCRSMPFAGWTDFGTLHYLDWALMVFLLLAHMALFKSQSRILIIDFVFVKFIFCCGGGHCHL